LVVLVVASATNSRASLETSKEKKTKEQICPKELDTAMGRLAGRPVNQRSAQVRRSGVRLDPGRIKRLVDQPKHKHRAWKFG
jgi:hypothetical protein